MANKDSKSPPSRKVTSSPEPESVTVVLAITRDSGGRWGYREVSSKTVRWLRNEGRSFSLEHIQVPRKEWDSAEVCKS